MQFDPASIPVTEIRERQECGGLRAYLPGTPEDQYQSGLRRPKGGVNQVSEQIWLVSFKQYDLGFFDHETCRIESAENPFVAKVSPMSPV
jgi:hypothetical protein